jgi:hypothetical protein
MIRACEGSSPPHDRHMHGTSVSRERGRMQRARVTIVTANLEEMCVFSQAVLQIEPQVSRATSVEFPLEAGTRALWRQSEWVALRDHIDAGRGQSPCPDEVCRREY